MLFFPFAGAENNECFQPGACRNSFHITGKPTADEFACLDFCKSEPECGWLTFAPQTGYCELLLNCLILDPAVCPDCLSEERECIPDEAQCWVQGQCQGVVDHFEQAASVEECLQLCNSTKGTLQVIK
jgi:hypothetical protein